jgi:N-acetylneuraminate synthase
VVILEYDLRSYVVHPETPLKQALRTLDERRLRMLVVVDEDGHLVGTFTPGDLNRWLISDRASSLDTTIAEVANRRPRTAPVDAEPSRLRAALEQVNFLPLVDGFGRVTALALRREVHRGLRIGEHRLGRDAPVFVIAEIGNNHNGSLDEARRLIDLAREAGADCAKFQMRDMATLYGAEPSGGRNLGDEYTQDLLARFQLSEDELNRAFEHCRDVGLEPLCTAWDTASVDRLEQAGMAAYKVASADLTHHDLLRRLARTGRPLLCSTGMSTEGEIREAVELLQRLGTQYVLLHCNSTYPAPFKDVNLAYLQSLAELGQSLVGYSGHERDLFVPVAAVALGAVVIEKHFTRDRDQEGNDHRVSLLPAEFARMVEGIRQVEQALGDRGPRSLSQGELMNRVTLAKSVHASRDIAVGEILSREALVVRAPGRGLQPNRLDELVSRPAPRALAAGEVFYPEDVDGADVAPRAFALQGRWGLPVRHHDFRRLLSLSNPRILEFHLSYRDLELDPADFLDEPLAVDLVVHAPELFAGDHTLDLASPDRDWRERSIAEMRRVIDCALGLRGWFANAASPIGIVTNVGGYSMDAPLRRDALRARADRLAESLARLEHPDVELWPQTMPPYPWHFGGQRFHNLFLDARWIDDHCRATGQRVCLDVSHSALACAEAHRPLEEFLDVVLPHTAHLHLADARGVDGEGLQIGEGDVDFGAVARRVRALAPDASWIPEIWQGHERDGAGFWTALARLERSGFGEEASVPQASSRR